MCEEENVPFLLWTNSSSKISLRTMATYSSRLRKSYEYYIVWCKAGIFFAGLIFGHSLVENAVVSIMITYLADHWDDAYLRTSVIVINAQDGLTSVSMIFIAYIADAYIGRFQAIIYTSISLIAGLVLLWFANPTTSAGLYILMAALLAVGKAGEEPPLRAFLEDHVRRNKDSKDPDLNQDRVEAISNIWWGIPHLLGVLVPIFVLADFSWEKTFAVSVIVMGSSFLFFLFGYHSYHPKQVNGSCITTIYRVFRNAVRRRGIDYSFDPRHYYKNDGGDELPLKPKIFLLSRWLDKAAVTEDSSSPLTPNEREERGRLNTVTEVKEVKRLLTMVPMWATFFMYCLVIATGNTFFFEQTTNLDDKIDRLNFRVPVMGLYIVQKFSNLAAAFFSNLIVTKKRFKKNFLTATKVRIGVGLAFSCLCCIVARMIEIKRLDMIKGIIEHDETVGMTVFWLVPQFCLLGITQGLTEDGLLQFFYQQAPKSMREYGSSFNELVLGIGKFVSILWILTFKCWIGYHINDSHLENYYGILAVYSVGNLFFVYGYVSKHFYKKSYDEESEDPTLEEALQQLVGDQVGQILVIPKLNPSIAL